MNCAIEIPKLLLLIIIIITILIINYYYYYWTSNNIPREGRGNGVTNKGLYEDAPLRGDSHIKKAGGGSSEILKEPLRGTKILFCGGGLKCFFTHIEIPILKQHIISCHIFSA